MAVSTLEEMEERARRYLDGITVNKEAMARDVLRLTEAIRSAQKRAAAKSEKSPFADIFGDIFTGTGFGQ